MTTSSPRCKCLPTRTTGAWCSAVRTPPRQRRSCACPHRSLRRRWCRAPPQHWRPWRRSRLPCSAWQPRRCRTCRAAQKALVSTVAAAAASKTFKEPPRTAPARLLKQVHSSHSAVAGAMVDASRALGSLTERATGRAADQDDLVDLPRLEVGILECHLHRRDAALHQVVHQCSNLARVSGRLRCFGPDASAVMNGRLMSVCIVLDERHLRLLGGFLEALERHRVLGEVDPLVLLELRDNPVDQPLVE